jgi:hypothetical protein
MTAKPLLHPVTNLLPAACSADRGGAAARLNCNLNRLDMNST